MIPAKQLEKEDILDVFRKRKKGGRPLLETHTPEVFASDVMLFLAKKHFSLAISYVGIIKRNDRAFIIVI